MVMLKINIVLACSHAGWDSLRGTSLDNMPGSGEHMGSKSSQKSIQKRIQIWHQCWRGFLPQNSTQNSLIFYFAKTMESILNSFFKALEFFGCLLGAFLSFFLSFRRLSCEVSGPHKPSKTVGGFRFLFCFNMQLFGALKLLMARMGPSWPLPGRICFRNGLHNCLKSNPKSHQHQKLNWSKQTNSNFKYSKQKSINQPAPTHRPLEDGAGGRMRVQV